MKNLTKTGLGNYFIYHRAILNSIIQIVKDAFPNDRDILFNVIELTSFVESNKPNPEFVKGLGGFITWCNENRRKGRKTEMAATLIHDLAEFKSNRNESWFSPRTDRYVEYFYECDYMISPVS